MKPGEGAVSRQPIFRQLDEKQLSSEADLLLWSPKMDLVAVASVHGEVSLYRLTWQKVWILSPPSETCKVLSMAWRPDGKVLAIGYSKESILLCDTENKEILHTNKIIGSATFMQWIAEAEVSEAKRLSVFKDDSALFFPKLPPLNKHFSSVGQSTDEQAEDSKKLCDQIELNMLLVGTDSHWMYLFAFGIFPCFQYPLQSSVSENISRICCATMSNDFGLLYVTINVHGDFPETTSCLQMLTFELSLVTSRRRELYSISLKYGQLSSLLAYVATTIQAIVESWEDILLEIDTKLMNYAKEKRQTSTDTVSDDFLELLMFGTPSDELEKFLLHDLTEKGLKKLGHSFELSYSNIQKLVLKHLQNVGQAVLYHLADIQGMALWHDRYGILGLSKDVIDGCIAEAGAFLLKATEIQLVIDNSMKNFKAFFRWIYVVILRLSDEAVTGEINKITQQDLYFVAQFLKDNFTGDEKSESNDSTPTSFNLERIGQYLKNEDLQFPPDMSFNPWLKFLAEHPHLKEEPMLYPYHVKRSLVQQHEALKDKVDHVFRDIPKVIGNTLSLHRTVWLCSTGSVNLPFVRHMFVPSTKNLLMIFSPSLPCGDFMFVQLGRDGDIAAVKVKFDELGSGDQTGLCISHTILDVRFYNDDTVSVLLMEKHQQNLDACPVLVQLAIKSLLEQAVSIENLQQTECLGNVVQKIMNGGQDLPSACFQRLKGMKASSLAVSGPRHVVCVTFASRHRVRLFEMDVEEDEEEASTLAEDGEEQRSTRSNDDSAMLLDNSDTIVENNDEDKEN